MFIVWVVLVVVLVVIPLGVLNLFVCVCYRGW